jgi:hypothetical protein
MKLEHDLTIPAQPESFRNGPRSLMGETRNAIAGAPRLNEQVDRRYVTQQRTILILVSIVSFSIALLRS